MPTYEYECADCGSRFERRQRFDEEPVRVCPECGGATRRVLFPVGIVFKGSGWYCTDNRSDGYRATTSPGESANGDSKNGKTAESKANGKADGKSESKGEGKGEAPKPAETASK